MNLNRWVVFIYLIIIAASAVLYIGNVNTTTELLKDIRNLEREYDELKDENKVLLSRIKQLEAPDRIIPIAEESLNMKIPEKAPVKIEAKDE